MKYLIIEDEKAAARNLKAELIDVLDSVADTIDWFGCHAMPELVFMDIHLADGSAFEIFEHTDITCPIIFTTAYDEYALRAFKVNSIDYLLKPIDKEEMRSANGQRITRHIFWYLSKETNCCRWRSTPSPISTLPTVSSRRLRHKEKNMSSTRPSTS